MARFVDLEMDDESGNGQEPPSSGSSTFHHLPTATPRPAEACPTVTTSMTPAVCNAITRAFQCYPIVSAIVSQIDLNTLDSLARTSRWIHYGLIQNRGALIASTLRCSNEHTPIDPDTPLRYRVARANVDADMYMDASRHTAHANKSSLCARDMVGECRRCAAIVCRNCAIKPPASTTLRERHRRLCAPCTKAPLEKVACPELNMSLPMSDEIMQRSLCNCDTGGVWLCQPCGRSIRNADHDYIRIWRWRNHYGEVLGCLGTGIGDADRGVICGRDDQCIAAREREQEIDCDAEDARGGSLSRTPSDHQPTTPPSHMHHAGSYFPAVVSASSSSSASASDPEPDSIAALFPEDASRLNHRDHHHHSHSHKRDERTPSPLLLGPGYERHEIEGIGGIVKRKLVRMVRVGKCVPEWEEERTSARVLGREARGEVRSWCGWCWRVVPGRDDKSPPKSKLPTAASTTMMPVRPVQSRPVVSPLVCAPVHS